MSNLSVRLNFLIISAMYFCVLSVLYVYEISDHWSHRGFELKFSLWSLLFVVPTIFILPLTIPVKSDVRSLLINMYVFVHFIPSFVLMLFGRFLPVHAIVIWLGYLAIVSVSMVRMPIVTTRLSTSRTFLFGIIVFILFILALLYREVGFASFNLNIWEVYDFRKIVASQLSGDMVSLGSLLSKVLLPIGLIIAFRNKNRVLLVLLLCAAILSFGFTQQKSAAVGPIAAVLLFVFFRKYQTPLVTAYVMSLVALIGLGEFIVLDIFGESSLPNPFSTLFIRRVLFIPALIDSYYVEFFTGQTKIWWTGLIDNFFNVQYPYPTTPPYLIAQQYFNRSDMSANTGFIGSGYANGGSFGVIIYGLVIGVIIAILNSHTRRLGAPFITSISLFAILTAFITSDMVTSLLTHGIIILLLLLTLTQLDHSDFKTGAARG